MKTLEIRDIASNEELDRNAMSEIHGGQFKGFFSGLDILSPDFFNKVTPITGAASIPTVQTNNLAQLDQTIAVNGGGVNGVSNNKYASQSNSNSISGVLNPFVG